MSKSIMIPVANELESRLVQEAVFKIGGGWYAPESPSTEEEWDEHTILGLWKHVQYLDKRLLFIQIGIGCVGKDVLRLAYGDNSFDFYKGERWLAGIAEPDAFYDKLHLLGWHP